MRFMVLVHADKNSEAGTLPDEKLFAEMGKFNEELVKAGVMLEGEGLHPTKDGARIQFTGKQRNVVQGPFPFTQELIAGYWIWKVDSLAEAIDWAKRCPAPMGPGKEAQLEIRQIYETEEFGEAFPAELRAQEERIRDTIASRNTK